MTKLGRRSGGASSLVAKLAMLCAALLFAFSVHAQIGATSSVSGQVLDAQHAAVVGATVTLTDLSVKTSKTSMSNDLGRYTFSDVQPGNYEISVTKDGFQTSRIAKQEVVVGIPVTLDFSLQVGATSLTVEVVSTAGAQLQTTNATTGDSLGGDTLLDLPAVARDASALVVFQPGVTITGQVAGQENDQNTFMVDGANNSQDMDGGNNTYLSGFGGMTGGTVPTPAESVEEFKVNTSGQTADFYSSGGAQVQMVTKKGTNNWHGSAYDFFQADFLNANDFADNQVGNPKIKEHQNRFGASLGGPLLPKFWGGKTYFYVNYEGRRFPQAQFLTRTTPTALMRAGVLEFNDAAGNPIFYNFNPTPTTVGGTTYPVLNSVGGPWDPRGIGVNSLIQSMWNQYMPLPNFALAGDHVNTQGFQGATSLPTTDDTGVVRIDHDLGSKWHLFGSYRIYKLENPSTVQTDIGGFAPGDTFGTIAATAQRPSEPSLLVAGLTGQLTTNLTNDLHVNYTRNDWQWGDISGNANLDQIPGVPAAVEPGGETANALIPMNVNTQSTRQRIWDGHDYYYRDDLSLLHGNHFFSFGGQVNRNNLYHERNDNGSTTDVNTTYLINSGGISYSGFLPTECTTVLLTNCLPPGQVGNYEQESAELLGIVDLPQVLLTRAGSNLALQPAGSSAFDQSTIMTYDMYFSDSWHIKPTVTLTYGLNYGIQMPPHEANGKQVMLVDSNGNPISAAGYLSNRYNAAINGDFSAPTYTPELGYSLVGNVNGGQKYPYDPFYGGFGPRVALAWSPSFNGGIKEKLFGHNSTVVRGGYSRIFTRENGVDLVLVPLLGVGLFQGDSCSDPLSNGVTCAGPNGATPATAFRLGTDGLVAPLTTPSATLPQPVYPGVNGQPQATNTLMLDSKLRPGSTDQFNLSLQRSFAKGFIMEVGYIGILANHLYMGVDLDQVPFMSTLGGQSFAQAYANIEEDVLHGNAIQPQPFIESAMAGSPICSGFTSCTAAVMASTGAGLNQGSNFQFQNVYNIWQAISAHFNPTIFPPFNPATGFGGTETSLNGQAQSEYMASSLGISNYNAGYVSLRKQTSFGLTFNANLTYSHEMGSVNGGQAFNGESPTNSWDPAHSDYTSGGFDHRFVFNMLGAYALPFGKGQHGFVGHVIGGWTVAPILTWETGGPILVEDGSCEEAGQSPSESNCSQAVLVNGAGTLNNVPHGNFAGVVSGSDGIGANGNAVNGGYGYNYFQNPSQGFAAFQPFVLGVNTNGAGNGGPVTNPNDWNLSFTVAKDINIRESMGLTFTAAFFNALNHTNWAAGGGGANGPATSAGWSLQDTADFGTMFPYSNPRTIELGLRFHF